MRPALFALLPLMLAAPAAAQTMSHDMAGMDMSQPATPPAAETEGPPPVAEPEAKPPPVPTDHAAERHYDARAMAGAREVLRMEHGGMGFSKVMANLLEHQSRSGGDGYRWEGEAWTGTDLNRLVIKTEGEGAVRGGVEAAEIQALYSRAVARYTDLQIGLRQDFKPTPSRTYLTAGFQTLLPYWLETQGAVFLSDKGDLLGRIEGTYDLRLTQRLILQPRVELNVAAQDSPRIGVGSGLSTAELGLRLRYEIKREFAPYVGVSYDRRYGRTADYARAAGRDLEATSLVMGVRAWF
ncbi:copper resistance protein B precursor [mine drainage metagenome]|uniref:Copper resistance protein B n=1 Tax=mine drainage metagenome TaxID=410659 RepID=A0A1J5PRK2_9ZZZZ